MTMPRIAEMAPSKFLKQDDVGPGVLVTISGAKQYNVAVQGADQDMKWCLEFAELEKPLVLNITNMRLIEAALGSDDTDDWIGKQIVLYSDPSITYGGKVVGGIRVRASKRSQPTLTGQAQRPQPPGNRPIPGSEIPF